MGFSFSSLNPLSSSSPLNPTNVLGGGGGGSGGLPGIGGGGSFDMQSLLNALQGVAIPDIGGLGVPGAQSKPENTQAAGSVNPRLLDMLGGGSGGVGGSSALGGLGQSIL